MKEADLTMASGRGRKFKGEKERLRIGIRLTWLLAAEALRLSGCSRKCHGKDGRPSHDRLHRTIEAARAISSLSQSGTRAAAALPARRSCISAGRDNSRSRWQGFRADPHEPAIGDLLVDQAEAAERDAVSAQSRIDRHDIGGEGKARRLQLQRCGAAKKRGRTIGETKSSGR